MKGSFICEPSKDRENSSPSCDRTSRRKRICQSGGSFSQDGSADAKASKGLASKKNSLSIEEKYTTHYVAKRVLQ